MQRTGQIHLLIGITAILATALWCAVAAPGGVLVFELNIEFSGGTSPAGVTPWVTATFDDHGVSGSVDLLLEAVNLVGSEFIFEWTFNLDPDLDPLELVFSSPSKIGVFADPEVNLGVNAFRADGDGYFDIQILFDHSGPNVRFGPGDSVAYTITGIDTLSVHSFDFLSAPAGGSGPGPFNTAAHVGCIGVDEDSGWITTPEPGTGSLALLCLLALARRRISLHGRLAR